MLQFDSQDEAAMSPQIRIEAGDAELISVIHKHIDRIDLIILDGDDVKCKTKTIKFPGKDIIL